ncbi:hypothetical protein EVA_13813 [gut metagenome]|uniref:Uncharacterized protein n=1 Tax=gut metagenome TaxID=749906 RepID=J9CDR1_9ZZZZ
MAASFTSVLLLARFTNSTFVTVTPSARLTMSTRAIARVKVTGLIVVMPLVNTLTFLKSLVINIGFVSGS